MIKKHGGIMIKFLSLALIACFALVACEPEQDVVDYCESYPEDTLTIVTGGQSPVHVAVGEEFLVVKEYKDGKPVYMPGARQIDGSCTLQVTQVNGEKSGIANGYELEAARFIFAHQYLQRPIRIVQVPWVDLSPMLTKNPSELRAILNAGGWVKDSDPFFVMNTLGKNKSRIDAGWAFTEAPHFRIKEMFYAHTDAKNFPTQEAKSIDGTPYLVLEGMKIPEVPSTQAVGEIITRKGNLWEGLLSVYGVRVQDHLDANGVPLDFIQIGNLSFRAIGDVQESFDLFFNSTKKDSIFYFFLEGKRVGTGAQLQKPLIRVGDLVSTSVSKQIDVNPPSPSSLAVAEPVGSSCEPRYSFDENGQAIITMDFCEWTKKMTDVIVDLTGPDGEGIFKKIGADYGLESVHPIPGVN